MNARHLPVEASAFFLLALAWALLSGCTTGPERLLEPAERRLIWPRAALPLGLQIDPRLADVYVEPVQAAVRAFNGRVGCRLIEERLQGQLLVSLDALSHGAAGVHPEPEERTTATNLGNAAQEAMVLFSGTGAIRGAYLLTYHGLGHVFGLAHDLQSRSVMVPNVGDYADEPVLRHLSDRQAALLRRLYCEP